MIYICFGTTYLASIFASIVTIGFANSCSNARIKEKGYKIKPMKNNSTINNIKYFFSNYGSSFIPVYNFFDSIMRDSESNSESDEIRKEYDDNRIKSLQNCGMVVKNSKIINIPKKVELKKEETIKEVSGIKAKALEEMTCYERRDYYKNEYEKACRECELERLKAEKDFLLSNTGEQMKLSRK